MKGRGTLIAFSMVGCTAFAGLDLPQNDPGRDAGGETDAGTVAVDSGAADAPATAPDATYPEVVIADGPIAYWRLGTTPEKDEVGQRTGTFRGSAPATKGALSSADDGARDFSAAAMDVDRTNFDFPAEFSIELWALGAVSNNPRAIISHIHYENDASRFGYHMQASPSSTLCEIWRGLSNVSVTGPKLSPKEFTHLVCTWDGSTLRLFWNGQPAGQKQSTVALQPLDRPLTIGAYEMYGNDYFFPGYIDEVAIYTKALSAGQVLNHFNVAK